MKVFKALFFLLTIHYQVMAQDTTDTELDFEKFVERLTSFTPSDEGNQEEIFENLYQIYQNPLDINTASVEQLRGLLILSEKQIQEIQAYKKEYGSFQHIYELQSLPSFDAEFLGFFRGLVIFKPMVISSLKKNSSPQEHFFLSRTDLVRPLSVGFKSKTYNGSPFRQYFRYQISESSSYRAGFVMEKDAGESDINDYFNFHVQLKNKVWLKNIIIGDFLGQFGQGLILAAGYAPGKGAETVTNVRRPNTGFRPYTSLVENGFFRGLSFSTHFKNLSISFLASKNKNDATLDQDNQQFGSLSSSGYHRTQSELDKKDVIEEQNLGFNAGYQIQHFFIGFTFLQTHYDIDFQKSDRIYNRFEFKGKNNIVYGPNMNISFKNINAYMEAGRSVSGGTGFVGGWIAALGSQVDWAFNFRDYSPDFHSFYGKSFSESSRNINETGWYNGLKFTIKKGLWISTYYDVFKFQWARFGVDAPSEGHDYQVRFQYSPQKQWVGYVALHHERKQKNGTDQGHIIRPLVDYYRQSYVVGSDWKVNLKWRVQTKVQVNQSGIASKGVQTGWAVIQDLEGSQGRFQWRGRVSYFSAEDYDTRVYAYENDLKYSISFPGYYGRGLRNYLIIRYSLNKSVNLSIRYAFTHLQNRSFFGSATDRIESADRHELKTQILLKF